MSWLDAVGGTEDARFGRTANSEDTMDRKTPPPQNEGTPTDATAQAPERESEDVERAKGAKLRNEPPRTTTGPITSPKFGSAGSGGAELEPPTKKPTK